MKVLIIALLSLASCRLISSFQGNVQIPISSILTQFDRVNDDLINLQSLLSQKAPILISTSSTEKCTLSKQKLAQVVQEINDALTEDDQAEGVNCEVDVNSPEGTCSELFRAIQCGVEELRNGIQNAKGNSNELMIMQEKYSVLLTKYIKLKDELESSISQQYQDDIQKLIDNLQELSKTLNDLMNSFSDEIIELIVTNIQQNNMKIAVEKFKKALDNKLNYTYILTSVIDEIYSPDKIDIIFEFLSIPPVDAFNAPGYFKLYDLMQSKIGANYLTYIKLRDYCVRDLKGNADYAEFLDKLEDQYKKAIKNFAKEMQKNDCVIIVYFAKLYTENRNYLVDTIKLASATNNEKELNGVFECVMELPANEDFCYSAMPLIKRMKDVNMLKQTHLYAFAYRSRNAILSSDKECSVKLNDIRDYIPEKAREIVWLPDRKCSIKNVKFGSFLIPINTFPVINPSFDNVVALKSEMPVWKFAYDLKRRAFKIRNNDRDMYMIIDRNLSDDDEHVVFSSEEKYEYLKERKGDWMLKQIEGNKFVLNNLQDNENIYCTDKSVTVRKSQGQINDEIFEINCL